MKIDQHRYVKTCDFFFNSNFLVEELFAMGGSGRPSVVLTYRIYDEDPPTSKLLMLHF